MQVFQPLLRVGSFVLFASWFLELSLEHLWVLLCECCLLDARMDVKKILVLIVLVC